MTFANVKDGIIDMLTYAQKRLIEVTMINIIRANPTGINTRLLINKVYTNVSSTIPNVNRHHIAGMIAWVVASTNSYLKIRTPGYSVIVE